MAPLRTRAVIVGVNAAPPAGVQPLRYAEQDAIEVRAALTHPETGTLDAEDVDLLTGPDATASNVKRKLRARAQQTGRDDVLLVYYAGHAFVPGWSSREEVYLATEDLPRQDLREEPDQGLRMRFLRSDVFEEVRGRRC